MANMLRKKLIRWVKSFGYAEVGKIEKEVSYEPSSEEEKEVMERLRKLGYF